MALGLGNNASPKIVHEEPLQLSDTCCNRDSVTIKDGLEEFPMPALQNLSLTDRTSPTPVAHNFTPRDVTAGVGLVVANSGVPLNEERFTVSMRKSGTRFRGKLTLALPIVAVEVVGGVSYPKLLRTAFAEVNFTFDESSTAAERQNCLGMISDALGIGKVLVQGALVNLEGVYG